MEVEYSFLFQLLSCVYGGKVVLRVIASSPLIHQIWFKQSFWLVYDREV
jgi:hypothetical protein